MRALIQEEVLMQEIESKFTFQIYIFFSGLPSYVTMSTNMKLHDLI